MNIPQLEDENNMIRWWYEGQEEKRETKSIVIDIVYYNLIILYLGWSLLCFKASGIPSLVCYVIYLIYTYLHSILYCKYTYQYVLNIQTLFKGSYTLQ